MVRGYRQRLVHAAHAAPALWRHVGKVESKDVVEVFDPDRLGREAPDVPTTIKALAAVDVEVVVLQLGKLCKT